MPKKRLGAEQIVRMPRQVEVLQSEDKSVAAACNEAGFTEQSCYRYRKKYGGLNVEQARKLKQLELENGRLKKLVADLSFEKIGPKGHCGGKLVSPERRRQAVDAAQNRYQLSERNACRIVGQPRGTQRYVPTLRSDEDELTRNIVLIASNYGRYGYRRMTAILNGSGMAVGKDRVQRIWRGEGLRVS